MNNGGKTFNTLISRKSQLITKLALLVFSISICLISVEFVLRKIIPIDDSTSFEFRIPHPTMGWVLEPGSGYYYTPQEKTVYIKYNSGGWRDYEHTVENPDGLFRILVLGDSFMEAYSVNFNESFAQRLEEFARKQGDNIEVINFGVGGYGTLQEYLSFAEHGKQFKPDLVLAGFFIANDVRNNSFELESIINKRKTRPFLDPEYPVSWQITQIDYDNALLSYKKARNRLESIPYKLARHSILLGKVFDEYNRIVLKLSQNREKDPNPIDKALEELSLLGIYYCEEPPEYSRAWDVTKRILSRLKNDVEAIDSRLVVFSVPSLYETSLSDMKNIIANSLKPEKLCIEEAFGNKRLAQILTELDIDFIDLLPDFRRVMRDNGFELFWRSDKHWNPEGHSLAAMSVIGTLTDKKFFHVPRKPAPSL